MEQKQVQKNPAINLFSRNSITVFIPLILITTALGFFYLLTGYPSIHNTWSKSPVPAIVSGFAAVFVFLIVAPFLLGLESRGLVYVNEIIQGADNRPSTSKLQFFWWTIAVIFAFAALKLRQFQINPELSLSIPSVLLAAMGTSAVTAVAAKAIAVNEADKKARSPSATPVSTDASNPNNDALMPTGEAAVSGQNIEKEIPPAGDMRYTVTDDGGKADLTKIQLLTWTVIAIAIFLWRVTSGIFADVPPPALPDIDLALVVLTGLAQGAYLGGKLVPDNTPWLLKLEPNTMTANDIKTGKTITVTGKNFGRMQDGSMITIDTIPVAVDIVDWSAGSITFKFISAKPADSQLYIGVVVGGQTSANALPLKITA